MATHEEPMPHEDEATELKPCPFCGGGRVEIEGKGQIWRGVKGYSDPQFFELRHFGDLPGDGFQKCHVHFRVRTRAEAIAAWNTRTDLAEAEKAAAVAAERERCAKIAYNCELGPNPAWSTDEQNGYETAVMDMSIVIAIAIREGKT